MKTQESCRKEKDAHAEDNSMASHRMNVSSHIKTKNTSVASKMSGVERICGKEGSNSQGPTAKYQGSNESSFKNPGLDFMKTHGY